MKSARPSLAAPQRSRGFTLVELLTVIAIMAVLAGIVIAGVGGFGGAATPAAQRTVSAMLSTARTTAQLERTNAYLLINANASDSAKYLRFLGIVYQDPTDPNAYLPVGSGTYLPRGIYVMPPGSVSTVALSADAAAGGTLFPSDLSAVVTLPFPDATGTPEAWYVVGFDKNGQTDAPVPKAGPGGARVPRSPLIVLAPGNPGPGASGGASGPLVEVSDPYGAAAIFIRPNGAFSLLRDFLEIDDL